MVKIITLSNGLGVAVDAADYEWLNQWKWHAGKTRTGHIYARRRATSGRKSPSISMHRLITQAPKGMDVDHIDGDTLNNVRSNLRVCTHTQNLWNQAPRTTYHGKPRMSKYKGVAWDKARNKWRVRIKFHRKVIECGSYVDEIEAAKAHDAKAREYHGEYARLNFP